MLSEDIRCISSPASARPASNPSGKASLAMEIILRPIIEDLAKKRRELMEKKDP